jgi:ATP-GRASP peptide maturase of grasp-with-spasm system
MILVHSSLEDVSTNDVLDWLFFLSGKKVVRKNGNDPIEMITIQIGKNSDINLNWSGDEIILSEISNYWYRRGMTQVMKVPPQEYPSIRIPNYLNEEFLTISDFINHRLSKDSHHINKFDDNFTNKLTNLEIASSKGINIPETIVTNDASKLREFLTVHEKVITKPLSNSSFGFSREGYKIDLGLPTTMVNNYDLDQVLTMALPALFQQYIDKKYELRIFYLKGTFFSMAIFSQQSDSTMIDFRENNDQVPNRCVPYDLPDCIKDKLHQFMISANLVCGSIDMIYTPDGNYVFLEVNPVGQYQWLERACNYPISKLIANHLI